MQRIRQWFRTNKKEYNDFLDTLSLMRQRAEDVVILPAPTGYSWKGVQVAGTSMFGQLVCQIPQYYSHTIFSEKQLEGIAQHIGHLDFRQVIWNGFPPYFYSLSQKIRAQNSKVKIAVVSHGFSAELADSDILRKSFGLILSGLKEGLFAKAGFARKGMAQTVGRLTGAYCQHIYTPTMTPVIGSPLAGGPHIGVLVNNSFRKNFYTQVLAALMVPDAVVHVTNAKELGFLGQSDRIVAHGFLPHEDFVRVLGQMHLNLHVTFSEGCGGQVLMESCAQGVPCLSALNSDFFELNPGLERALVVQMADDAYSIAQKIQQVLPQRAALAPILCQHIARINEEAKGHVQAFLEA